MHLSPRRIDLLHLVQDSRVDSVPLPELFRGADNKLFFRVDNPADVIGNPSGGKGGVRAPLKYDDVQLGPAALCLGRCAHPRCIAADDDKPFFAHGLSSGVKYQGKGETLLQVLINLTSSRLLYHVWCRLLMKLNLTTANSAPEVGHSGSRLAIDRICDLLKQRRSRSAPTRSATFAKIFRSKSPNESA